MREFEDPQSPFFRRWAETVIRFRGLVVLLVLAVTGGALWLIQDRMKTDVSVESFLDSDSEALQVLEAYRDWFGRDDAFLVLAEGDVFNGNFLQRLRSLHEELAGLDVQVDSLGERISDRKAKVAESLAAARAARARPQATPKPATPADAAPAGALAGGDDDGFGDEDEDEDDFGDFDEDGDDFGDFDEDGAADGDDAEAGGDDWGDEAGGTIVDEITSLVNARKTRSTRATLPDGSMGSGLEVGELMDPWPEDIAAFKAEVLADPLLVGQLVDPKGRFTVIMLRTQFMSDQDTVIVHDAIGEILDKHQADGFRLFRSGLPALAASLNRMMLEEIQFLFLVGMIALVLVMTFIFRHPMGLLGPCITVMLSAVWTFGFMAATGMPVTMLSNVLPAFLICVGVGDSIHLQSVYRDHRRAGLGNHDAIVKAIGQTGVPVLFTSLTTMFGLLSFQFATIDAVGEMGTAGAFGVFAALTLSLLVVPVVLTFNTKSLLGAKDPDRGDFIDKFLDFCAWLSGRRITAPLAMPVSPVRRRRVLLVGLLLSAGAITGAGTLRVWHDPLSWIPETDPTRVAFDVTDQNMGGTSSIQLLIESTTDKGLKDLELLRGLDALQKHINSYEDDNFEFDIVGTSISLLDVVKETHRALNGGAADQYRLPDTQAELEADLFLFEQSGPAQLRRLASADLGVSQMTVRVRWLPATSYGPLTEWVGQGIEEHIGDKAIVRTTGAAYTIFTTVSSLIGNLLRSFSAAFLVITLFMILLLRDLRLGLVAMVPNLMPIVFIMGGMGFVGIPIDMTNLLIASIAIGLAVDDTIHFLHHYKVHYDRNGDVEAALGHSLRHSGRAIVATSLILCAGFFVYLGASLVSLQRFGALIGCTIILALLIDLILGPALIRSLFRTRSTTSGASDEAPSNA